MDKSFALIGRKYSLIFQKALPNKFCKRNKSDFWPNVKHYFTMGNADTGLPDSMVLFIQVVCNSPSLIFGPQLWNRINR